MAKIGNWYYAENVHQQANPNVKQRRGWHNNKNAQGKTELYATSSYSRTMVKDKHGWYVGDEYNYPWTISATEFGIGDEIPNDAIIKKLTFRVRARCHISDDVKFPAVLLCIYGSASDININNAKDYTTGWHNGLYMIAPRKLMSMSDFDYCEYVFDNSFINFHGKNLGRDFTVRDLKSDVAGVDLLWGNSEPWQDGEVDLKWVALKVDYELPTYKVKHNINYGSTSRSNPWQIVSGQNYSFKYTVSQTTDAKCGIQKLKLRVPFGVELQSVTPSVGSFNMDTHVWSGVDFNGKKTHTLNITFKDYTVNKQCFLLSSYTTAKGEVDYPITSAGTGLWFKTLRGRVSDYDDMDIQLLNEPHLRNDTCFAVTTKVASQDNIVKFSINDLYENTFDLVGYSLDANLSDSRVSINEEESTGKTIAFNLPPNNDGVDIAWTMCLRFYNKGNHTLRIVNLDNDKIKHELNFKVLDAYEYHFGLKTTDSSTVVNTLFKAEQLQFNNHRIASELGTGAYILPCKIKERDANMIQTRPSIHMYKWEEVDYIGCVPLEHLHFDPKSTYKDKLLDSHYKNKRYMGKELASDEEIDLNVRLHPHQVPTIQGLIDMDKPVPINANHRCFEGDPLNHRGWIELYGIKTEPTGNNPHWYTCEIDVKYLTHNLNSRLKINKGNRVLSNRIPSILTTTVKSGEKLSNDQNTDFFVIDTDGTYYYAEDGGGTADYLDENGDEVVYYGTSTTSSPTTTMTVTDSETGEKVTLKGIEVLDYIEEQGYVIITPVMYEPLQYTYDFEIQDNQRNQFTLDEGQHLTITSREVLTNDAELTIDWASSILAENKENNVSRVIRLIDKKTNNAVFEYEYFFELEDDYIFDDEFGIVETEVIGRKLVDGDYDEVINEEIDLGINLDSEDDDYNYIGSTIHVSIKDNVLTIDDDGYSGKEIPSTDVELEGEEYYFQLEFRNHNTDGEDNDIVTYVDLIVNDSLHNTAFSNKYGKMYVSPFPIARKNLLFTREAEEGIIYYYEDDGGNFTYLIDPYYVYHNGVDLRNSAGTSIFNLNYGFNTVYIVNGLISLGVNRLNGELYLQRWDTRSKRYITTHTLQLTHYDDINVNNISDDVIEIQASNTVISMHRGHPYVFLKHRGEDIKIKSNIKYVYGESVNGDAVNYPSYFDLMNTANLLDKCVGGVSSLKSDCVSVTDNSDELDRLDLTDITLSVSDEEVSMGDTVSFSVTIGNVDVGSIVVSGDATGYTGVANTYTALVEDSHGAVVSGVNVSFYRDNTLIGSSNTNSSGVATFNYVPSTTGESVISCKSNGVNSNNLNVTYIQKTTSLTFNVSDTTIIKDNTLTLSGVLGISGVHKIKLYDNRGLITELQTLNNGDYTHTITCTTTGTYTYYAVFEGDLEYAPIESVHKTVNVVEEQVVDALSVYSSKDILSYADSDSTVLYCQLMGDGEPVAVEGESCIFKVYKVSDDGLVDTITGTTDNTGLATGRYYSTGVGDVYVTVECMSLTKTFTIKDIYFYDDGTSSTKSSNYDLVNAFGMEGKSKGTLSITTDGEKYHISNSDNNYKAIPISLLSSVKVPFKLSCKITNNDVGLYAENGAVQFLNKVSSYVRIVNSHKTQTSWNPSERIDGIGSDTEYTLELTANNGTLTYKIFDGTTEIYSRTKTSSTYNNTSNNVNFGLIMERYGITFKEVMIELL